MGITGRSPLIMIEWVIALSSLIGGIYVLSPLLTLSIKVNGQSAFVHTVASDLGIAIFGLFFTSTALVIIAGIMTRRVKWRATGLFLNGLGRLYVLLGVFIATGPLPLHWLSNATIMIICFLIWRIIRVRGTD